MSGGGGAMNARAIFGQIFRTQWQWTRLAILAFAVMTFVVPTLFWRMGSSFSGTAAPFVIIDAFANLGLALTIVSLLAGFVLAALPWQVDAETRHVYAYTLPIPWRQFLAMRYGAGILTLLVPTLSLYLGAWFVLWQIDLPSVLHAYPFALSLRYFLALTLAYTATFALQYVFGRRATLAILGILLVATVVAFILGRFASPAVEQFVTRWLFEWPGPFALYLEPWRLLDV